MVKKGLIAIIISLVLCTLTACQSSSVTAQGFAMDTTLSVTLYGQSEPAQKVIKEIESLEGVISWSKPDSALAKLNETGKTDNLYICEIAGKVAPIADYTQNRYNLLMRPLCRLWDINGDRSVPPTEQEVKAALNSSKGEIILNDSSLSITGSKMDLGSVGKGYACDRGAALLAAYDTCGIITVGGSIALCGTKPSGDKWKVSVASPEDINKSVGTLSLEGGNFISTSGDSQRYFEYEGNRYHHIIDGKTGYPSKSDLKAVTVVCNSGLLSDALSTACFIVGYEKSLPLLEQYNAQAVFIKTDGKIVTTSGLEGVFKATK